VVSVTATEPPVNHKGAYLPMALVNSGYLDVSGVAVKK
jgi:hypothetical protein